MSAHFVLHVARGRVTTAGKHKTNHPDRNTDVPILPRQEHAVRDLPMGRHRRLTPRLLPPHLLGAGVVYRYVPTSQRSPFSSHTPFMLFRQPANLHSHLLTNPSLPQSPTPSASTSSTSSSPSSPPNSIPPSTPPTPTPTWKKAAPLLRPTPRASSPRKTTKNSARSCAGCRSSSSGIVPRRRWRLRSRRVGSACLTCQSSGRCWWFIGCCCLC